MKWNQNLAMKEWDEKEERSRNTLCSMKMRRKAGVVWRVRWIGVKMHRDEHERCEDSPFNQDIGHTYAGMPVLLGGYDGDGVFILMPASLLTAVATIR